MNTVEELVNKYGLSQKNAEMMIEHYKVHIGEQHGDYDIIDMTYVGSQSRVIKMKCRKCNTERECNFVNRKNKISELPTICPICRSERVAEQRNRALQEKIEKKNIVIQNEIGNIYGDFKVIGISENKYIVQCTTCGVEKEISITQLLNKKWERTRCTKHYIQPIKYDESYIGQKNNYLTVIGLTRNERGKRAFKCKCDCGQIAIIEPTLWSKGYIKSCGCYAESLKAENNPERHRLQNIFRGMIQRCYNLNDQRYTNYGGRGISICDEWLEDREKFIEWSLKHGYSNELSIDRINVNGDYEPGNCRWATYKEQANNRRPSSEWEKIKKYEYKGKKYCLKDFAKIIGKTPYLAKKIYEKWKNSETEELEFFKQLFEIQLEQSLLKYANIEEVKTDFSSWIIETIEDFSCLGQQMTKNQAQSS